MRVLLLPFARRASQASPQSAPLAHFELLLYPQLTASSPLFAPPVAALPAAERSKLPLVQRTVDHALNLSDSRWAALHNAGRIRHRIWLAGERLKSLLDPDETFLKHVPLSSRINWDELERALPESQQPLVEIEYPAIEIPCSNRKGTAQVTTIAPAAPSTASSTTTATDNSDDDSERTINQQQVGGSGSNSDTIVFANPEDLPYDCGFNAETLKIGFESMVKFRLTYHRQQLRNSLLCIPLSMLFGLIPVPNVALMYNAFRVFSHWRALQGARTLDRSLTLDKEHRAAQSAHGALVVFRERQELSEAIKPYVQRGLTSEKSTFVLDSEFAMALEKVGVADNGLVDALSRAEAHCADRSWAAALLRAPRSD